MSLITAVERACACIYVCYKRCCSSNLCVADQEPARRICYSNWRVADNFYYRFCYIPAIYRQVGVVCCRLRTVATAFPGNPPSCSPVLPHLYQVNFLLQFCNVRTCMHAKTKFSTLARLAKVAIICKNALLKFYNPLSALDFLHFC